MGPNLWWLYLNYGFLVILLVDCGKEMGWHVNELSAALWQRRHGRYGRHDEPTQKPKYDESHEQVAGNVRTVRMTIMEEVENSLNQQ